jgi:hypothetical protein
MKMKWYVFALVLCLCASSRSKAEEQPIPSPEAPATVQPTSVVKPQRGMIVGTVIDVNDDMVPNATVVLEGPIVGDQRTVVANDNGFFELKGLDPGTPYHVTISAKGFANWTSPAVILNPGQYVILTGCKLQLAAVLTKLTVNYSSEGVATEQVKMEETQRVFGIIPNFYVVYNHDAEPLTTKLKFRLALKVARDPVTVIGVGAFAGINQAADVPDYGQGTKGYAKRYGALAADGFTNIMIGGAILPSLLHQDPRYFYKGTGSKKSRSLYALAHPFVCKGDNGKWQPNYSSMGGDLISSAISNAYYPASNRGAGLVFGNFLISSGQRMVASLVQEFVLGRFTSKAKNPN